MGSYAQDIIYHNDFNNGLGDATIIGTGAIEYDATKGFDSIYHNATGGQAIKTNYLLLDSGIFEDITLAGTYQMSVSFWVNRSTGTDYYWSPIFTAYGDTTDASGNNGYPMFALQTRTQMMHNLWGWCDYVDTQNVAGANTVDVTWIEDDNWHMYTMTLDTSNAIIYIDDTVANAWTLTNTNGNTVNGMFEHGNEYHRICLGGNQAWNWPDPDPAFQFDDLTIFSRVLRAEEVDSLHFVKTVDTAITESVCYPYVAPSGKVLSESGIYTDTIPYAASTGDSVIAIFLTVGNTYSEITTEACVSYTSPSGKVWTVSDTYTDTINNAAGCDSIITINLSIVDVLHTNVTETLCDQASFTSSTGKIWSETGEYHDTLTSAAGCDSVITYNLTFAVSSSSSLTDTIYDDTYTSPSGKIYSETGIYKDTIPNAAGCDSIITINLTIIITSVADMQVNLFSFSPNPTTGIVNIVTNTPDVVSIKVYNVAGVILFANQFEGNYQLDMRNAEKGLYFISIQAKYGTQVKKLILK